ncbi:MAG TPA: hypothetical protein VHB20_05170 [Verrucomicrobiae bacterium]|jgi:hypothetical protein|nr:hypothetical protein [Verrucomicrobiae bacterium]
MAENPFQPWLDKTANYSGILACGIRQPNQTTYVRSYHETFSEPRLTELMQKLTETAFNLRQSQLGGSRLRWAFEHGRIHTARRTDGALAMLAVNNDPSTGPVVEEILGEFLAFVRPAPEGPPIAPPSSP